MQITRKDFFVGSLAATAALGARAAAPNPVGKIQGFDESFESKTDGPWEPFSDKKVRVGIAGYGVCTFGAVFFFQDHPKVVAATDLDPVRCAKLAQVVHAKRTYPSAEEMIDKEGKNMDAVFIATDAASHADLVLRALDRGYHVCSAVPALLGERQLDRAPKLVEAVKKSGRVYALFETTAFRPQAIAMRRIYEAGGFGQMVYTEGEYFHYSDPNWKSIGSYKGWRVGLPPQYYPTHSNGFYTCVTHGHFTEVSCVGTTSDHPVYKERKNPYGNPFHSEVAFFKTSEGGSARMTVAPRRARTLLRHEGLLPQRPLRGRQLDCQEPQAHPHRPAAGHEEQRSPRRLAPVSHGRLPARDPRARTQGVRGCGDRAQHHGRRRLRAPERAEGRRDAEGAGV